MNTHLPLRFTTFIAIGIATAAALMLSLAGAPGQADARPSKCFGKKINRVVSSNGGTVRLKYRDVAWVSGKGVTVIGKPFSRICAGEGSQTIRAGKGINFTD